MLIGGQALAQTPPPALPAMPVPAQPAAGGTPEQMPFAIALRRTDRCRPRGGASSNAVLAEAQASTRRGSSAISVVDPSGDLVYFYRMDGAQLGSIRISRREGTHRRAVPARVAARSTTRSRRATGYVRDARSDARRVARRFSAGREPASSIGGGRLQRRHGRSRCDGVQSRRGRPRQRALARATSGFGFNPASAPGDRRRRGRSPRGGCCVLPRRR